MAEIGYGQTRIQVTEMVKKILDRTGRLNPFQVSRPGVKTGGICSYIDTQRFLLRHPKLYKFVGEVVAN